MKTLKRLVGFGKGGYRGGGGYKEGAIDEGII